MAYINDCDYREYMREAPPDDFEALAMWASEQIDAETGWKLQGGLEHLPDFSVKQIKKAACMQVKYLDTQGGVSAFSEPALSSFTLGKFSASEASSSGSGSGGVSDLSPMARHCLISTGLLFAGVRLR